MTCELIHLATMPDVLYQLRCLHCHSDITLHQPDESFPERMLGVCVVCNYWFLMDLVPGKSEAVLVLLPDGAYFRQAMNGQLT